MYQSPRMRRLRNDRAALGKLHTESSVFSFSASGDLPQHYRVTLRGKSLWRDRGKIRFLENHLIEIKLGASYPRTMPEIRWLTPIYHPNISEIGMVCLGGYGTHWVPSVQLDELCIMLWDMARYHNYDIRSPYNRDAALWVASQTKFLFPTDPRPLRDKRVAQGRMSGEHDDGATGQPPSRTSSNGIANALAQAGASAEERVRQFLTRYRNSRSSSGTEPVSNGHRPGTGAAEHATEFALDDDPPETAPVSPHQADGDDSEEVVLLESVNTIAPAQTITNPAGDEIIFLD